MHRWRREDNLIYTPPLSRVEGNGANQGEQEKRDGTATLLDSYQKRGGEPLAGGKKRAERGESSGKSPFDNGGRG